MTCVVVPVSHIRADSFVTLFELMVVNNWFVIMDGFVAVTNDWARLYFMLFYICAVVGPFATFARAQRIRT